MTTPDKTALPTQSAPPELIAGTSFIGVPLMLTAMRCTLQYIVVPLILPVFSISSAFSPLANLSVGLFGIAVILYNLTRLWKSSWRTRYLLLSLLVVPFILVSMYFDFLALGS
ncbi:MAG: hypothetical protein EPO32_01575 [Anaerolineae bacterium]|nr:MAG: hypothetical protein EPO32_01575 [Anaerolineae bacterium]